MRSTVGLSLAAVVACAGAAFAAAAQPSSPSGHADKLLADGRRAIKSDAGLAHDPYTVLVRFDAGTSEEVRAFARMFVGGTSIRTFRNVTGLEHIRIGTTVPDAVESLLMIPGVEFAEPDYVVHAAAGTPTFRALRDNDAVSVELGKTIASIGAGVSTSAPELAGSAWINAGELPGNGVDDDQNGYIDDVRGYDFGNSDPDPTDDSGLGPRGAPARVRLDGRCTVMALKTLNSAGTGVVSDGVLALDYAVTMGADSSECSWTCDAPSAALKAAIESAREMGHAVFGPDGRALDDGRDGSVSAIDALRPVRNGQTNAHGSPGAGGRLAASNGGPPTPPPPRGLSPANGAWPDASANGNPRDPRAARGVLAAGSAQDLDISLGLVSDPLERFIPTIATWRYIQSAIDSRGEGRGIQLVDSSPHDGKVATGNNSVWFGVDFIADRTDQQQYLGGEVGADGGCLVYIDPTGSALEADLCFAVIVGSRYSVCRLPGVVRPGVRTSFQASCRLNQGDWQLNPFHGPPSTGDPARVTRASVPPLGASLAAFEETEISAMRHWGAIPKVMAGTTDLLSTGPQGAFFEHGSFSGKLFAFEYHPSTYTPTVAEFPQPTRAKTSFTFRGLSQDPQAITNRGTARELTGALLTGPRHNRLSSGGWLAPGSDALSGDVAGIGEWLRRLGAGERCVAVVFGDSNSAAAEGGLADALVQTVMTYYGGYGYDARPDVYWSATMSDNHPLRQYAGLGGRISYGGDISADPQDIPIVSGSGSSLSYPFPSPQEPFANYEWATYAGSAMHTHRPGANSIGLLSAFCTSDTSDTARWRLPNIYGVQNTADGAMNDSRVGHARLAGPGLLYARSRTKAGDLVCVEAVLGQRVTNPGGSVQFAVRAQDGADAPLPNGGRLANAAGGLSGAGWLTVDAGAGAVDADREAMAAAYTGYAGQALRPATMDTWSTPTTPLSGIGRRNYTRVRTQPWVMGETVVPGAGIAIAPAPVSYQPHLLLKRRTICSMFGLRIIENLNPGQDHPRLPWTMAMVGIGGTRAIDQMGWLFDDIPRRVLRDAYWRSVLDGLNASGAHVLIIHVESQNSAFQLTGVAADALDDKSDTWAGFTGAKIRGLQTLAQQAGAASVHTIAINSPHLTSDMSLPRGEVLREIAPLIEHCAAIDLYRIIGQRETMDSLEALNPYLPGGHDMAHPHYTILGTPAFADIFAEGLKAAGGGG